MDHDQLFKELLQAFLPEFLDLFVPQAARELDWGTLDFLSSEVFADPPRGSRRAADVVARVRSRRGEPEVVLVHVEVEAAARRSSEPGCTATTPCSGSATASRCCL